MPGSERRSFALERTMVVGGTGSGKTELAAYLTRGCSRLIVIDTNKVLGGLVGAQLVHDPEEVTFRSRQVWQPPPGLPTKVLLEMVDRLCQRGMEVGDFMGFIDELASVSTSQTIPPWLAAWLRQGRAHRIGMIYCTQRDVGASNPEFFAQAQHLYVGHSTKMSLETLRKRVDHVDRATTLGYASGRFLFYENMQPPPRLVGPVPLGSIRRAA
ncbi:MAG: hypothetical protein F4150_07510 [Chloroflexi bacterium]|nr:hypothetical protein [Chloroflexota bacterium]